MHVHQAPAHVFIFRLWIWAPHPRFSRWTRIIFMVYREEVEMHLVLFAKVFLSGRRMATCLVRWPSSYQIHTPLEPIWCQIPHLAAAPLQFMWFSKFWGVVTRFRFVSRSFPLLCQAVNGLNHCPTLSIHIKATDSHAQLLSITYGVPHRAQFGISFLIICWQHLVKPSLIWSRG